MFRPGGGGNHVLCLDGYRDHDPGQCSDWEAGGGGIHVLCLDGYRDHDPGQCSDREAGGGGEQVSRERRAGDIHQGRGREQDAHPHLKDFSRRGCHYLNYKLSFFDIVCFKIT